MCGDCGRNFKTEAGLAWSLPVNVCSLGAHLDAHVTAKPAVHQLVLCHRFGQGEEVFLKRLPREIINLIIDHYTAPIRTEKFAEWDQDFACYEGRCDVRDHFGKSEWYSFLADAWDQFASEITDENEHEFAATIAEDRGDELDLHGDRSSNWEGRICQRSCPYKKTNGATIFEKTHDGNFTPLEEVSLNLYAEVIWC
jgi:hypothetical protein